MVPFATTGEQPIVVTVYIQGVKVVEDKDADA